MKRNILYLSLLLIPSLVGCASKISGDSDWRSLSHKNETSVPLGLLQIYTATEQVENGDSPFDNLPTAYTIYDQFGNFFRQVPNHVGNTDTVPGIVSLPVGQYQIKAESERYGRLKFPVEIKPGRICVVHLEENSPHGLPAGAESELVRLQDGKVVGWREGLR